MKLFKNEVGRPSNQVKKKRRILVVLCVVLVFLLIGGIALWISNSDILKLEGSTSKVTFKYNNKRACVSGTGLDGKKYTCDKEYSQSINLSSSKIKVAQNKFTNYGYNFNGWVVLDSNGKYLCKTETGTVYWGKSNCAIKYYVKNNGNINSKKFKAGKTYNFYATWKAQDKYDIDGDGNIGLGDVIAARMYILYRYYSKCDELCMDLTKNNDIVSDGEFDVKDLVSLRKILSGMYDTGKEDKNAKNPNVGDLDNNGKIDEADTNLIVRYAAGNITNITAIDELKIVNSRQRGQADVNMDGKVNIKDVYMIMKNILYGDVNQDGKVTIDDVVKIMSISNKKVKTDSLTLALADYDCNGKVEKADALAVLKSLNN